MVVSRLSPSNKASNVCADAQLQITFSSPIRVTKAGRIQIHKTADDTLVDTIDLAVSPMHTNTIAGKKLVCVPVTVKGNVALIHPHAHVLEYDQTYHVTIEPGVFVDLNGNSTGVFVNKTDWQFTTRSAAPPGEVNLVVAADGSGDFCTVQGAVDHVPEHNTTPKVITIKNGTYEEVVYVKPGKNKLTFRGEDRKKTIIAAMNNDQMNSGSANRSMVVVAANEFTLENMTLINTTPPGGSQAEALRVDGDAVILRNTDFISYQDTLMLNGCVYVSNCFIIGDVDFIFGAGQAVLEDCDIVSRDRNHATNNGYITAASTQLSNKYGFLVINSRLKKASPSMADGNVTLGRPWHPTTNLPDGTRAADPNAVGCVVFKNCYMEGHIAAKGWDAMSGRDKDGNTIWFYPKDSRFYEYGSSGPGAIKSASRRTLSDIEAQEYTIANVLGGWTPEKK